MHIQRKGIPVGKQAGIAEQITTTCLMGRTRYLSRVLTAIYDEEVRPFGVQATQVTLLATVAAHGPVRRSDLGRWLHFDSSTLTRNLRVMLANEWLQEVLDGKDGRGMPLQVTEAGADLLRALGPAWHRAQGRALQLVGDDGRTAVIGLFDKVQVAMAA
jgi:DNA-binding MarR family transcriptional regulator